MIEQNRTNYICVMLVAILACFFSSVSSAEKIKSAEKFIEVLNKHFLKIEFKSHFQLVDRRSIKNKGDVFEYYTFQYAPIASAELIEEKSNIISYLIVFSIDNYKDHEILRESMAIFSYFIANTLSGENRMEKADRILQDLWDQFREKDYAQVDKPDWKYRLLLDDSCGPKFKHTRMYAMSSGIPFDADQLTLFSQTGCR